MLVTPLSPASRDPRAEGSDRSLVRLVLVNRAHAPVLRRVAASRLGQRRGARESVDVPRPARAPRFAA
jgi:hypothetical protein